MIQPYIIAIDGLAASGKTTLTKNLANKLGFEYLLTGNLYRLVAKNILDKDISPNDIASIVAIAKTIEISNKHPLELTSSKIAETTSVIATYPELRSVMDQIQRDFAQLHPKGVIVEGRDIGTVIFPNANIKLFIKADDRSRATRRYKELRNKGFQVIYEDILEGLKSRDDRDKGRSASPLMIADDAIEIDTSDINTGQLLVMVLDIIKQKAALNRP